MAMSKAPMIIAPTRPVLVDKRIEIKVVNLRPFQNVTLRVDLMQTTGKPIFYESYGHFISDMQGTVKVANDASFGGTYKGIDGMGLFWSMLPVPGQRKGVRFTTWDVTRSMEFKVSLFDGHVMSDGKASSPKEATAKLPMPLANATILRTYLSENVERHEISVGQMRGTLFVPKGNGRFPGNCYVLSTFFGWKFDGGIPPRPENFRPFKVIGAYKIGQFRSKRRLEWLYRQVLSERGLKTFTWSLKFCHDL